MAKDKAKNEPSKQKGGVKSSRWSAATIANKARRAATRAHKLSRRTDRRKLVIMEFSANDGSYKNAPVKRKREMRAQAERGIEQVAKIEKKIEQRENFRKLSAADKAAHREAGRNHGKVKA